MTYRRLRWMLWSMAALLVLGDALVPHTGHFALERVPGFYALFGWLTAVVLGVLTRGLARLLQREERSDAD